MAAEASLDGTVALVTGASSGIGEATARLLADRGAAVVIVARRADRLEALADEIEVGGGKALAIEADVTDREQAEAAVRRTAEELGRLDVLVNNAGVMLLGPILDAPVEEWDQMVQVNLLGLLYTAKVAIPHLLRQPPKDLAGSPTWSTSHRSPAARRVLEAASTTPPSTRSAPSASRCARRSPSATCGFR